MEEVLLYFALKYQGDFDKIFNALETKEIVNRELKDELMRDLNSKYTTLISNDYPQALKEISCPPFVLFYHGDLNMINNKTIGILGSSNPSGDGITSVKNIIKELDDNNIAVVTGMEKGIEEIANDNCKKRISVLGCGIDKCYLKCNKRHYDDIKENGLIISEYPNSVEPKRKNFARRNRIISGLSEKILVFEISKTSKKMTIIGFALEQGKDIYCVPCSYNNEKDGTNCLISQGAEILTNVGDFIQK